MLTTIITSIITALGGSGITVLFLRLKRKHYEEIVEEKELSNADKIVKLQVETFIEPLRIEVKELRHEVQRLVLAIDQIKYCKYTGPCPVRLKLIEDKEKEK